MRALRARHAALATMALFLTLSGAACAPTQILTGSARAPISPAEVEIFSAAPTRFEAIAVLSASSRSLVGASGASAFDRVVERLKAHAAKLGANGLILDDLEAQQSLFLGSGVSADTTTRHGSISLGLGGFFGWYKQTGTARAIYVPPRAAPLVTHRQDAIAHLGAVKACNF